MASREARDGRSLNLYKLACGLLHHWNFGPNVRGDIEEAAVRVRATYDELRSVVKYLRSNYVDVYLLNSMTGKAEGDLFTYYLSTRKPRGRPSTRQVRRGMDASSQGSEGSSASSPSGSVAGMGAQGQASVPAGVGPPGGEGLASQVHTMRALVYAGALEQSACTPRRKRSKQGHAQSPQNVQSSTLTEPRWASAPPLRPPKEPQEARPAARERPGAEQLCYTGFGSVAGFGAPPSRASDGWDPIIGGGWRGGAQPQAERGGMVDVESLVSSSRSSQSKRSWDDASFCDMYGYGDGVSVYRTQDDLGWWPSETGLGHLSDSVGASSTSSHIPLPPPRPRPRAWSGAMEPAAHPALRGIDTHFVPPPPPPSAAAGPSSTYIPGRSNSGDLWLTELERAVRPGPAAAAPAMMQVASSEPMQGHLSRAAMSALVSAARRESGGYSEGFAAGLAAAAGGGGTAPGPNPPRASENGAAGVLSRCLGPQQSVPTLL